MAALYTLTFLILTITPQKRLNRFFNDRAEMSAVKSEVEKILKTHSTETIQMGYGDSISKGYGQTFIKPILTFAGNQVTVDAWSDMETQFASVAMSPKKLAWLKTCQTRYWLIPKGQVP